MPADWRTPKVLYAVEVYIDRAWHQLDHITPFRDAIERKAALFDRARIVVYDRCRAGRVKREGSYENR